MTFARIVIALGIAGFVALIAHALSAGAAWDPVLSNPWGWVTVWDLYLGLALWAFVIWSFERSLGARLLWILPLPFLGFGWGGLWLLLRLPEISRRLRG